MKYFMKYLALLLILVDSFLIDASSKAIIHGSTRSVSRAKHANANPSMKTCETTSDDVSLAFQFQLQGDSSDPIILEPFSWDGENNYISSFVRLF
jgi:hypothetical protein